MIRVLKYPNRKLYVPKQDGVSKGGYVTLHDVADMVRAGQQVQVVNYKRDSLGKPTEKHGEDITETTLKEVLTHLAIPATMLTELIQRYKSEDA